MKEAGIEAGLLHLPNLRLIRGAGEMVAEKLREEVGRKKPEAIVLQFLDNSVFEALTVEGTRIPPRKCEGRHHLDGDIAVAEKATTVTILRGCRPIFNATAGIKTVMIGAMPRYVTTGCCNDPEHMANRVAPGFLSNMKRDLAALNRTVKDFLHNDGYENIRAMDPWVGLRQLEPPQLWGADPVHIKPEHMVHLVRGVQIALERVSAKKRRDSDAPASKAKKRRTERGSGDGSGGSGSHYSEMERGGGVASGNRWAGGSMGNDRGGGGATANRWGGSGGGSGGGGGGASGIGGNSAQQQQQSHYWRGRGGQAAHNRGQYGARRRW
jgi:hypothetical protein